MKVKQRIVQLSFDSDTNEKIRVGKGHLYSFDSTPLRIYDSFDLSDNHRMDICALFECLQ